jgi:hypothetical protein
MRGALLAILILIAVAGAAAQDGATAQEEEGAFEALMERGIQAMGGLGISLKEKDAPASVDLAKQASAAFAEMYAFLAKRNAAGPMAFAKAVQVGFAEAGELAAAGKLEEALAKWQTTRAHCDGCHRAHRVRATDGSYTLKY